MDFAALLDSFAKLGPPLGAVVAIGLICFFLIKFMTSMFIEMMNTNKETTKAIDALSKNIEANTRATESNGRAIELISRNMDANTHATLKMTERLNSIQ